MFPWCIWLWIVLPWQDIPWHHYIRIEIRKHFWVSWYMIFLNWIDRFKKLPFVGHITFGVLIYVWHCLFKLKLHLHAVLEWFSPTFFISRLTYNIPISFFSTCMCRMRSTIKKECPYTQSLRIWRNIHTICITFGLKSGCLFLQGLFISSFRFYLGRHFLISTSIVVLEYK